MNRNIRKVMSAVSVLGMLLVPGLASAEITPPGKTTQIVTYTSSTMARISGTHAHAGCGATLGEYAFDTSTELGKQMLTLTMAAHLNQRNVHFSVNGCVVVWGTSYPLIDAVILR